MEHEFKAHDDHLEVMVTGEYSFPLLYALIDRMEEEARKHNLTRILADLTRIAGMPTDMERFDLGVKAAEVLKPPYKILTLAEPEKINKFGEDVAVNRGALLLATSKKKEGREWLLSEEMTVPIWEDERIRIPS